MTPAEVLQQAHVRYEGNTDYPTSGDEDFTTRLAFLDDAVSTIERRTNDGFSFDVLVTESSIVCGGTGTDTLPANFLSFLTDVITAGSLHYTEVTKESGNKSKQEDKAPYVFWEENGNLRSLPALSGTITLPYQRTLNRFPLGSEVTDVDGDTKYYLEYILAMLYLADGDLNLYNVHANIAEDILKTMTVKAIMQTPNQSTFGIGM